MAYLICCEYPAHPPADGSSIAKGSADTALVCNVTVCALLLFMWYWVRRLPWWTPVLLLECCNRWQIGTTLYYKHLESRSYHTHTHHSILLHFQEKRKLRIRSFYLKVRTTNSDEYSRPERWFQTRNKTSPRHCTKRCTHVCNIHYGSITNKRN